MNSPENELQRDSQDRLIIIRCAWCQEWLNEASKVVAETRDEIEWVVSDSICQPCSDEILLDFRTIK